MFGTSAPLEEALLLCLSYLTESEHLVWGLLEGHGDLGQVGGAPPQQTLPGAAGWNKERRPSSKLLHPVLQLLRLKVTAVCSPRTRRVSVCWRLQSWV